MNRLLLAGLLLSAPAVAAAVDAPPSLTYSRSISSPIAITPAAAPGASPLNLKQLRALYADIVKNGIYLAGGGALIKGLDKRLNAKTGIPFHVAEDPLRAIARGTGIALKNINRFSFLMK